MKPNSNEAKCPVMHGGGMTHSTSDMRSNQDWWPKNLNLNILLSEGVPTDFSFMDYFSGDANYGRIGLKISDGETGKLLWKYENVITKKTGKNTYELIDKMMRTASRKFPYDKEKKKRNRN